MRVVATIRTTHRFSSLYVSVDRVRLAIASPFSRTSASALMRAHR